ncbi:hypothetical protein [Campylobacter sputorum]|uniref:hypothetical protein n=1 Tax=Campylobacter sputorum TaxID=206 RepID=UPI0018964BF9|nr:hypothetical protein [Campylobacter sp. RM11259]MBF6678199.1 hypothetical protein [Campylobacter sp. RM11259]
MFKYRDSVKLNQKFNKSVNIIYDDENCQDYILTTSTLKVIEYLVGENSNNSVSIIGPFGSGKSSLLLYINTLLSDTKYAKICLDKLSECDKTIYDNFVKYKKNKNFLRIKIVGEHISFKTQLKTALLEIVKLKNTIKYLKENEKYQVSVLLEILLKEADELGYTDVLLTIDEFGKFIEYSLEERESNDIFELQTVAEFVNTQKNFKLIVSLHKTFREYNGLDASLITYTDWDKIQGRFENIVFKDDYFEMLNIFKESFYDNSSTHIQKARKTVKEISKNQSFAKQISQKNTLEIFEKICPLHPYSVLIIAEVFTKYFQNQRTIYSFLFSAESFGFQEFLDNEFEKHELYDLANLYDYVSYLLKIYTILLPDREIWYLSEYRLKDSRIKNNIQKDIIKTISLLHTFKLNLTIIPNDKQIVLSLLDKYKENDIKDSIRYLEEQNIIIFQEQTKSYSLLEDSNIDINKEMKNFLSQNINMDYEKKINHIISKDSIVAKRFFSLYGLEKSFQKKYISTALKNLDLPYKVFLLSTYDDKIKDILYRNEKSVAIVLKNHQKLEELVKKIEILKHIRELHKEKISKDTNEIISSMIQDYKNAFEVILNKDIEENEILYKDSCYVFSHKKLQELLSKIVEINFSKTPIINSYTLNHTINSKGTNTTILKALFKKMLCDYDKENLAFEKFPAEKALYLSVIKPAGIHKKDGKEYKLFAPDSLNFKYIWKSIKEFIDKRVNLVNLLEHLSKEPFGLSQTKTLFVSSLFFIVHKDSINIFRENTYIFDLNIDLLMNMWKASDKFEIEFIKLNKFEEKLFEGYVRITSDIADFSYSKENITAVTRVLFGKFNLFSDFSKNTQKLSKEAISLRSVLSSMKEPKEAYFESIPKALRYKNIQEINLDEFIFKFKNAFNEIALSYKNLLVELESFISDIFYLDSKIFPFNNSLSKIAKKLNNNVNLDKTTKSILKSFIYSDSLVKLLDSLSINLIKKEIDKCTDNDIKEFKNKLKKHSIQILDNLEITELISDKKDVRKISLNLLDNNLNKIISIDKDKIVKIDNEAIKIKKQIPKNYTKDEKLYLISQLLKEELKDE